MSRPGAVAFSLAVLSALICLPAAAHAEVQAPGWEATSFALPTNLPVGGVGTVAIRPQNVGAADSDPAQPILITDTLPAGLTALDAGELTFAGLGVSENSISHKHWHCTISPGDALLANSVVTCENDPATLPTLNGGAGGASDSTADPGEHTVGIAVEVSAAVPPGSLQNRVQISGGGALQTTVADDPLNVDTSNPGFGFTNWDGWFSNADGSIDTQAGSVPYSATFSFDLNQLLEEGKTEYVAAPGKPFGEPRNFLVNLPPGFIGNPTAVPQCTREQLIGEGACPRSTVIGRVSVLAGLFPQFAVYNMVPPEGVPAQFAFTYESISTFLNSGLRSGGDYGINTQIVNAPQKGVLASNLVLWGVPADPTHNLWRGPRINSYLCETEELEAGGRCDLGPHPPLKAFLRLPTSCSGPQPFAIEEAAWFDPEASAHATFLTHDGSEEPVGFTGCNQLPFDPTISSKPTTNVADAPTGLEFDLHIPQPEVVNAVEGEVEGETRTVGTEPELHEADLKQATVTLPKGIAVNPASAGGLAACTSAQIGLTSKVGETPITTTPDPAQCPDAAKIGSVEVDTPLLDHPVKGGVYVATPLDNPFGSLLAIYIAVNDEATGTVIKLAGQVEADPVTGQLTTTFANNPQLPFEDFHLNFFGGAHAALRTPATCSGPLTTTTDMTPWSTPEGADAFPGDSFELTQGAGGAPCASSEAALPNKPNFEAGTLQPKAGAYSPFVLHLARQDGSQEIKQIDATLPEGLIGKLAGISECSDAQIAQANSRNKLGDGALEKASPSCPLNSEVGTVNVGAGAGPDPYYVTGHAYLAGPYKGAPLSLEIITPAVAGPYDLGAVAVRTALYVNSETAQIHAVSDEIPHILQGIPLDVRAINLQMSRPNFTLNPTSCAKKTILGNATSVLNQSASLSSPFQVGECSVLGFKPKLAIHLKGDTKRSGNPALRATVTYPSKGAYSNIARASVALPHSEFLDQAHIKTICTRVQFAEGNIPGEKCPAGSIYGHARAITPLLDQPLEGPVYLRSSSHPLPDLVAALNGQIQVVLDGTIDSVNGGIRNRFEVVPDAPVSKFTLTMQGGKKGLLVNSTNLCKSTNKAVAKFTAQNGKVLDTEPVVTNSCKKNGGKAHKKGSHKHKGAHK